jgi:phosphopantothenoylcysteine decarboxylase/phosphopantothenate--cysteine ligase
MDPVRYVQNRSSGKMGLAVARAAAKAGASVSVLLGPVEAAVAREFAPFAVTRYQGPAEYAAALDQLFPACDAFLSLAAVLDFELQAYPKKLEREFLAANPTLQIPIMPVPDFVARMAGRKTARQTVIAFAAEGGTNEEIIARARKKMTKKGVDAIVANPVREGLGPEADENELWLLRPPEELTHFGPAPKDTLAAPLLEALFKL